MYRFKKNLHVNEFRPIRALVPSRRSRGIFTAIGKSEWYPPSLKAGDSVFFVIPETALCPLSIRQWISK